MTSKPTTNYIPFKETNYFSDFICDYLAEKEELKEFYHRFPKLENFEAQIKEKSKSFRSEARNHITKVLKHQYKNLNTSDLTADNIESLNLENTFTITTGHQLNLPY